MLIRISLFVAIAAGLTVGGLNFVKVKDKITTLNSDLKRETEAHQTFEKNFNVTKKELDKTKGELTETKQTLATTTDERDKAVAEAATQTKKAEKLNDDLGKTREERDSA